MPRSVPRSVHGGALPFDERWIRREAQARLFGEPDPLRLGRYEVRARLGAGGMGTVYAAWDPELERDVAIKILHAREPKAAERLRREARALAALAHPNVVMVFEVGQSEGVLFIVMEHVDGQTLRAWQGEHGPDEVLAAYVQAGRGLAAAHEAGLVHGDFKPDNALVHRDGRVRVADFGLAARGPEHHPVEERVATLPETVGGGTPGYRAPELQRGQPPDARSDQFAFCVSLHEGLTGRRCDGPEDLRDLPVSRRVHDAIARGLHPDPKLRFPSIDALLQAFEPRRRAWLLAPLAGLGASLAVLAFGRGPDCDDVGPRPWSDARDHARLRFETAPRWVADTWPVVDEGLRAHEAALARTQTDACRIEPGRSPELAQHAEACLDAEWNELRTLSTALAEGKAAALSTAALRIPTLMSPLTCRDEAALERVEPISDGLRERLLAMLLAFDRLPGQSPIYTDSVVEAGLSRGGPLEGLARRVRAQHALERGADREAAEDLQIAAALAEADGDANARIHALATLAFAIGRDTRRLVEAERVAAQALSALDASGAPDPILKAKLLHDLASVAAHARPPKLDDAIAMHEDATRTLRDALGPEHPLTLRAQLSLGTALTRGRRTNEALETLTAADTQIRALWEPSEPTWIRSRRAVGLALLAEGDAAAALQALSEARAARISSRRDEPLEQARDAYNVALALRALGRLEEARETLEDGFPLAEDVLGRDHPELTPWAALLGNTTLALGRTDEAVRWFERGLALSELDGAAPKEFAKLRVGLAESLQSYDVAAARVHLDAALRFLDTTEGFDGLRARAKALDERLKAPAPPPTGAPPPAR